MALGVGLIGSGPGVSALHLPTLARLPGQFAVAGFTDSGSGRARVLADRWQVPVAADVAALAAHPSVDVLAVCSPPQLHAAHVLAGIEAGVRAILCEKPLAMTEEEARAVVDAARDSGVALLVGTNHLHDSAWRRAKHHLLREGARVRTIGVAVALPPNSRYHELVTQYGSPAAAPPRRPPDLTDPAVAADVVRQLVLGLAIHDLPAVRDLVPSFEAVDFARFLPPIGLVVGFRASGVPVQLAAVMLPDGPDATWTLTVGTSLDQLEIAYPPAFVHAGSATVRVRAADGRVTEYAADAEDSYVSEWRALHALAEGEHPTEYDDLLDDALYAIAVADGASARIWEAAR
ncbi:MAG TPA: Gfo/Idh/MocA family oxidoreductase [Naasia sp.]|jgi:predicted dehydrogenase